MSGSLAGLAVLLVEDEPVIAMDYESLLLDEGANVTVSTTLREALSIAQTTDFSVAIVDFLLGTEQAAPLCSLLSDRGIPFIVCSGANERELAKAAGAGLYLTKPIDYRQLISHLTQPIERRVTT